MLISEKSKTVLEINAQHAITLLNVLVVSTISLLLTIWLTNTILLLTLEWKLLSTLLVLFFFVFLSLILYDHLNYIKRKIMEL